MDYWLTFWPWIVSALGGAIGAAVLLPTKVGEALIKFRFDKQIEGFKADQGAKLERLREQLGHLGDRGRRSNELEFAAIREMQQITTTCTSRSSPGGSLLVRLRSSLTLARFYGSNAYSCRMISVASFRP
jgi:hypothetical protein